ncbi:MAG: cyanophycinase [Dokdonella sp.]|uniref:cyanophycinase n=1 Tax=Dokdonella sp. TaxID=2291710 RepID=UPI0025C447D5|nr:cyanophycinase [Dokdonella sp.]MBX3700024.1 cyanophycinase [Dokdonella sp.]
MSRHPIRPCHRLLALACLGWAAAAHGQALGPDPQAPAEPPPAQVGAQVPAAVAGATRGYRYYAAGDLQAATPQAPGFGLMLMGGGDYVEDAFRWFAERAGHGHVVVLRASGSDDLQHEFYDRLDAVASVETFVFERREAASDPFMLAAVARADGIFIAGGDQARYIRYWKGTPLNAALDRHVREGKPLGGTSAGLAILGSASYGALDGGSIDSLRALTNPLGDAVTLDDDFLHLPFLSRVVTDSHFGARDRLGRLVTFLARAEHDGLVERPIGIGVDENTALCIDSDGIGRVYSESNGHAWLVRARGSGQALSPDAPLTTGKVSVTLAGADSRIDLATFHVEAPVFDTMAAVRDGELDLDEPLPEMR